MVVGTDRAELHAPVDRLTDDQLPKATEHVEFLLSGYTDKLLWVLDPAPYDDEPMTPEEEAAVAEARKEVRRGETMSMEEAKRLFLS